MKTPHVLVLDDERAILDVLTDVLGDEGWRVTTSAKPLIVEEVVGLAPDAIVLDLLFGGRELGLEFLASLRCDAAARRIPVVICTAMLGPRDGRAARRSWLGLPVVTKPFDLDEIVTAIRAALGPAAVAGLIPQIGAPHGWEDHPWGGDSRR